MFARKRSVLATATSFLLALSLASKTCAQINYSEDFDSGIAGWTINGGYANEWFSDSTACSGGAMRSNLYSGAPTCEFRSPLLGTSLGGTVSLCFDYKCNAWSANTVPVNPWGTLDVEFSNDTGLTWVPLTSITDELQTSNCIRHHVHFTPGAGTVHIRFLGTWSNADYWLNIDNVSVTDVGNEPYGAGCGFVPVMDLSSPTLPVSPSIMTFTINNWPPLGGGTGVGYVCFDTVADVPGTPLPFEPFCNLHLTSGMAPCFGIVGAVPTLTVAVSIPPGIPPCSKLYSQAFALVPPTGTFPWDVHTSNGLASTF